MGACKSKITIDGKEKEAVNNAGRDTPIPKEHSDDKKKDKHKDKVANDLERIEEEECDLTVVSDIPTDDDSLTVRQLDDTDDEDDDKAPEKVDMYPVTDEECKALHLMSVNTVKDKIEIVNSLDSIFDFDGGIRIEIRNSLLTFYRAYFYSKRVPLQKRMHHRAEIAKMLIAKNMTKVICGVASHVYKTGWTNTEDGTSISTKWNPLMLSLISLNNFTDSSEEFCIAVCEVTGFLELMKRVLERSLKPHLNGSMKPHSLEEKVLKWVLGTVHNLSMRESCVPYLRHLLFSNNLIPFLKSSSNYLSLNSLASLAGMIDDKENNIITANHEIVLVLMECLRQGLDLKQRRCNGWSCKECAVIIRLLAKNKANRRLLAEVGSLELLVKMGNSARDDDEQLESVSAISALAQDEDIRKAIVVEDSLDAVELLLNLKESTNPDIKEICTSTLYAMWMEIQGSDKYKGTQM